MFLLTLIYPDNKKCGWSTKSPDQRAFTILNRFKSAVEEKYLDVETLSRIVSLQKSKVLAVEYLCWFSAVY